MATETGTATDYRDLLQKLKLFLTGESVSPIGSNGLNWVVEEERSASTSPLSSIPQGDADELMQTASNNNQDHDQIIFRSTGGTSPEQPCYFGIQTYGLSTTGYFNWQIRGLTGFASSSPQYVSLADQPGRSPPAFLPLQNTTMTYWFIANNRRVMGCVKTGTAYHSFYIGFINPFATNAEYPYPMCVAATAHTEATIFSSNGITVSSAILAGGGDSDQTLPVQGDLYPAMEASGFVRFTDGNWYGIKSFSTTGSTETAINGTGPGVIHVWPASSPTSSIVPDGLLITETNSFSLDFRSTTPGGTPEKQIIQTLGSPTFTTLWPLTLYNHNASQLLGEYDGCYWAPGAGGLTSEDTIVDFGESPEVTHIVFQNTHKTDAWQYLAMRNE